MLLVWMRFRGVANDDRVAVALRELLQDESFRSSKRKIPLALGKDVYGNTVVGDLAAMPHCLVAGATGAGPGAAGRGFEALTGHTRHTRSCRVTDRG